MSLHATVGQYHLPYDQQQPDPSSWPSSSSTTSTTNIFHVCTRQLLLRHSSVPFSSPVHRPTHPTVHIPRYSHVNPSTVIKSTSCPPCLTDAIEVCASVLDPSANRRDISDDSTIVISTGALLLPEQCATVSHHYASTRPPTLILCHCITSSHDNILTVCRLHLKFIPPSSIPS